MKLKDFRTENKLTQKQLADALKVNQQTIARWEKGQTEPNIQQLRDLAMIFSTSIDAILGKEKPEKLYPNFINDKTGDADYFWGHIGINLYGVDETKWYPVTEERVNRFYQYSANEWFVFETLNNRYVAINQKNTRFVTFSDDNAESPETPPGNKEWTLTWKEDMHPKEFYRGLEDLRLNPSADNEVSKTYQKIINEYIEEKNLTDDDIAELILHTGVYDKEGQVLSGLYVDDRLGELYLNLEDTEENEIVTLSCDGNYYSFNEANIALIESPRLQVKDSMERDLEELNE